MFRKIRSHLERRIEGHIQGELTGNGRVHPRGVVSVCKRCNVHHKDTRGVVHRTAVQAGERKNGHMTWSDSSEGLMLGSGCRLVAYEVRICPAEAGRTHCLMSVDHDLVLCGLIHDMLVMVHDGLAVMVLSLREDPAHIAGLDGIVTVFVHKTQGLLKMTFIIAHRRRCLMVHHESDTLGMGIVIESLDVKIRIRGHEIEYILLATADPFFPSFVPTFHKHLVEAMLRCEINIAADILICGSMLSVRGHLAVISHSKFDMGKLVSV